MTLPNLITIVRACAIPWFAWLLLERDYGWALAIFVSCAVGDALDGAIARHWNMRSRFGAIADPLADKLTMLTAVVLLSSQQWLPWWYVVLVVGRDVVIVAGAIAYHLVVGRVDMSPTLLSKLNTLLEFVFLAAVLAFGAGLLDEGPWFNLLLYTTTATVLASGVQYVWVWAAKARAELAQGNALPRR